MFFFFFKLILLSSLFLVIFQTSKWPLVIPINLCCKTRFVCKYLDLLKIIILSILKFGIFSLLLKMSAEAAYQKWLQSSLPSVSKADTKSDEQTFFSGQTMEFVIFAALYILLRIIISLFNWYSRYNYFKSKRTVSVIHSLYYTWFYCSGIGNNAVYFIFTFFKSDCPNITRCIKVLAM